MDNRDKVKFMELMNATCEYYSKTKFSDIVLKMYFSGLCNYQYSQVEAAIGKHLGNTKSGQFIPKVADIVREIEGGDITTDYVISQARLAKTPFGILCRIQIGSYDLTSQTDMFYLRQRAQECIDLLPEWKARAVRGDYTDHEIGCMLKHDVSAEQPFLLSMLPAPNSSMIAQRAEKIRSSVDYKLLLSAKHEQTDEDKQEGMHEKAITRLKGIFG